MQTIMQVVLEGGTVKVRQEEVDVREVQVNKLVDEVWLRGGVINRTGVEAKRVAFLLLTPVSRANDGRRGVRLTLCCAQNSQSRANCCAQSGSGALSQYACKVSCRSPDGDIVLTSISKSDDSRQ
jgi:hypothetical protein